MTGTIFDLKRFSMHDGPGIRTTVFLKGCPLACVWCHNPESQPPETAYLQRNDLCVRCSLCVGRCPRNARSLGENGGVRDAARCVACGTCAEICPAEAVTRVGREVEADALVSQLAKDLLFFDESGGGVTFSGGEPLNQPAFLRKMLVRCRAAGLHCALDTSGYAPRQVVLDIARQADLILYDIKLVDPDLHKRYTGVSNACILENLRALSMIGVRMEIRMPIIPGITDTPDNLDAAAAFIRTLPSVPPVRLLAHHHAAMSKYRRFGMVHQLGELDDPSSGHMAACAARLKKFGIEVFV